MMFGSACEVRPQLRKITSRPSEEANKHRPLEASMLTLVLVIQAAAGAAAGVVNADITQRLHQAEAAGETLAGYQSPHLISAVSRRSVPSDANNAAQLAGLTMSGCVSPHLVSARTERSASSKADRVVEVSEVMGMSPDGSLPATARSDVLTVAAQLRKVELLSYARKTDSTRRAVLH
jgi:hypothetical protein